MILSPAADAYWINQAVGLALVIFVGIMILQSVITDWCPVDLILRPLGLKKKLKAEDKSIPLS